ncbi:aminopeptidase P N-terminal domain-containing protein [Arcanobacterium phocisimile]|uniref:Xaa-Pro aminopeptidase n=1 Tax=Arcanobacterium phocisimile TaxID=1302235 RepID=A0ABX7IFF0_9ACTO|nr:aminopeptidase P N-terminal domain-containing protein [Arcanobacterium phocisimile]QRV01696.1 aminopeptidase P N-terminal domain-containing protein [Arcanobacterium phocisimile]
MTEEKQSLEERAHNRTQRPQSDAFRSFIGEDWGARPAGPQRSAAADYLPARHFKLGSQFRGERLVFPAGDLQVRSNDTDYRFRAHSAFAHLTGLGGEDEPGAVLVLEPLPAGNETPEVTHEAVLYFHPRASRSSEEFYADSRHGEFWVGARLSAHEMSTLTGLNVAHIDTLRDALAKDLGEVQIRVIPEADAQIESLVEELRQENGLTTDASEINAQLAEAASELRLIKDEYEIAEMQKAVDVTASGFDEIVASFPRARTHWRGERVIEGAFFAKAREEGNGLGYDTIAAAGNHANTLHWIKNDGPLQDGTLMLIDAGAEVDSLYTADITRTLPVSGKFSDTQRLVYEAVLEACDYALDVASQPGVRFRDIHAAAMTVIARHLHEWGILPVSPEESLLPENQQHRRWMPHGTSHHLGLDVHDCAQAKRELYQDALLEEGMVFTIEPGLYFREDDLKVPEEFRGIGVRIEDDIVITKNGAVRISENIPRTVEEIENWMARLAQ